MKLEIKVILPTGEDVFFTLEEAKELYKTLKDIFEPVSSYTTSSASTIKVS